jgi:Planctomycete cytochrome C/WD domain, G-beta repeat
MKRINWLLKTTIFPVAFFAAPLLADEEKKITFEDHIKPIFREHCTSCHHQGDKASGLALDTYADTIAGGAGGKVVNAGNIGNSRLYALVSHTAEPKMPPDQDPIAKEKQDLLKTWIDQGMPENAGSKIVRASSAATAMLSVTSTGQPDGPPALPEKVLRQPVVETDRSAAIAAMAASPWAPLVAIGGQEQVVLYHTDTAQLLGVIPFPEGEPQSLSFTRDGKHLLIGGGRHSHSGCAILVDVTTGQRVTKVGDEIDIVLAADISPDKRRIAIGGPQKMVRVFDSATGAKLYEMKKHTDWIYTLRFSPDGVLLASGDRGNGLVVWEAATGNLYADLVGHKASVTNVDFRMDSNLLASSSHDGNVKFWDMMESKEVKNWAAHGGGANDVRFTRDGRLVTVGKDAKVKFWNGNGELVKEFSGLAESALRASVTGDGAVVIGGDWNGKVQLWRTDAPEQTQLLATNPPTIEKRLQQSSAQVAAIGQELATVAQVATETMQQSTVAASEMTAAQEAAKAMETKLAEATVREQTLKTTMAEADQKMKAMEAELAALKAQREAMAGELTTTTQAVQTMTVGLKAAQDGMAAAQAKMQQLSQAAEAAKQKQAEVQNKFTSAQAAMTQAQADKVALEKQAAELTALAQQSAAQAKALSDQMTAALQLEQSDKTVVEKMNGELTALKDQLSALQRRMDEIAASHKAANDKLVTTSSSASDLKSKASAAEQAAVEAQEQLKLFQKVYSGSLPPPPAPTPAPAPTTPPATPAPATPAPATPAPATEQPK